MLSQVAKRVVGVGTVVVAVIGIGGDIAQRINLLGHEAAIVKLI